VVTDAAGAKALFVAVDEVCRRHRALSLIVEPDRPLPLVGTFRRHGFVRGPAHIQPSRTVKVPLLADEALLEQMHQKTRYNVRLAKRREVAVERVTPTHEALRTFYRLLQDTSERNAFGIHRVEYYQDFTRIFDDDAILLFALIEGMPVAGLISARFGDEAVYMYGGSSTANRAHGAAFLLQFEAMRWARDRGCRRYDLWGIPAEDPVSTADAGERVASTRGDDWRGLYRFKTGFGGEVVRYPATLERRYRPALAWLARRVYTGRD
jgi:lipid II:glycine glycyltransferase (peptidoglycan interpeptide bridge formation enzyme)